jgi:cytochrome c-type biogenesis protein CcmF
LVRSAQRARRRFGGYIVHLGVICVFVGVAASSAYRTHATGTLHVGANEKMSVGGYELTLGAIENGKEPHRTFTAAHVKIRTPSGGSDELSPRMNFYERSTDPVPTPSVRSLAHHDLYVSLIAVSDDHRSASFNVYLFPFVAWIWGSLPFIVIGSLIAAWPQRRKAQPTAEAAAPEAAAKGAA